jgi:hypothetical protein
VRSLHISGPSSNGISGIGDGSCSCLDKISGELGEGVFQGTVISLTTFPLIDSVAEIATSIEIIGTLPPPLISEIDPRGVVALPEIWKRFQQ